MQEQVESGHNSVYDSSNLCTAMDFVILKLPGSRQITIAAATEVNYQQRQQYAAAAESTIDNVTHRNFGVINSSNKCTQVDGHTQL